MNSPFPAALPPCNEEVHAMPNQVPKSELKSSRQIDEESVGVHRQLDDGVPRRSEDDMQRAQFGPRGVPGQPDPAVMVPQRKKKTPTDFDPGHTA
jgi:hypothetical protein